MAKNLAQLTAIVRQKSSTDGIAGGNQIVTDPEIAGYINEAMKELHDLIIGVDASYYESVFDFSLASSATGNVTPLPSDFYKERGLVLFPDTEREVPVFSMPFAERTRGKLGYTFDGNNLRVFPWMTAGQGPWRLYYVPKAKTFDGDFKVRVASGVGTTGTGLFPPQLPPADLISAPGVGETLQAQAVGALIVDGITVAIGDRILVLNSDASTTNSKSNGIWSVVNAGSASALWVIRRATDFDQPTDFALGASVSVADGTLGAGLLYRLTSFSFFGFSILFTVQPTQTLDVTQDNFEEYITNKAALVILVKRQMDLGAVPGLVEKAEARVRSMVSMRTASPEQAPVMWHARRRRSWYDDDGVA